jgi:hypothetical protein
MKNFKPVDPNDYRSLIQIDFCKLCGISTEEIEKKYLAVDHINSDHDDNRLENLQVLCKFCHETKTNLFNYIGSLGYGKYENFLRLIVIANGDASVKSHLKLKSQAHIKELIKEKDGSLLDEVEHLQKDKEINKLIKLSKEQQDLIDKLPEDERRSFIEKNAFPVMKKAMELTFDLKTSYFPPGVDPNKIFYENIGSPKERKRFKDKDFLFTGLPYLDSISDNWLNVMSLMYKYKREFPNVIEGEQISWSWFICEDVIRGNELNLYFNNLDSYQSFLNLDYSESYPVNNNLAKQEATFKHDYKQILKAFIYKSYGKKIAIKYQYKYINDRPAFRKIENEFGYSMFDKKYMQKINNYEEPQVNYENNRMGEI